MRCWPIAMELGGREFDIPALPAADWWPVIVDANIAGILDLIGSSPDVEDMLMDGRITADELAQVMRDVVEQVSGRSLHVAFVIASVATGSWPLIGGQLAQTGFRWDVQPIGAALDALYVILSASMKDDEARAKFDALLDNEALTGGKPSSRNKDKITAEFETMAGPRPTPAPLPGKATDAPSDSPRPRTRTRPRPPRQSGPAGVPKPRP